MSQVDGTLKNIKRTIKSDDMLSKMLMSSRKVQENSN